MGIGRNATGSATGESGSLFETTLMVELSDCSRKGGPRGAHPAHAVPFCFSQAEQRDAGGSYRSMTSYKRCLPVILVLAWLAVPTNAGQGASRADPAPDSSAADSCARLATAKVEWPDATTHIKQSAWHADGSQVALPMAPPVTLPAHCELTGAMEERVGVDGQHYAIRFHLRLPLRWNGKFLFEGGGGTEGDLGSAVGLIVPGTPPAIAQGYAVVSQDSGHDNATNSVPSRGGNVAFGFDPEARANYGGSSLRLVAETAKTIIHSYYGRLPAHSYFVGCSKGGQEGMVFAQRFPDEFDGIVAGAPGFSLPRAAVAEAWDTQAFGSLVEATGAKMFDPKLLPTSFSETQFRTVREAILAACDADDGVQDGITSNFESCTWPRVAKELNRRNCSTSKTDSCLSDAQIKVLGRVHGGPKNSRDKSLYSDWPVDAGMGSDGWRIWKIGPAMGGFPGHQRGDGRAGASGDLHYSADRFECRSEGRARFRV